MTQALTRLLVVDDNAVDRERVLRMLGPDFALREAASAADAVEAARTERIDCVLLDYRLPDSNGLSTLDQLAARGLPIVMLTGQGDERTAVDAMKRGAQDYLVKKSLDAAGLRRAVSNAMETVALRRRVKAQRIELEDQLRALTASREQLARSNQALREREAELRLILSQLPAIVWTTDPDLVCVSMGGATRAVGIDDEAAQGRRIDEVLVETATFAAHRDALAGGHGDFQLEHEGRTLRCRTEPLRDVADSITGVIGVALDITETLVLEQQFRHAQKMEALGQLAGGVAHDFNNLLTAIISFAEFARDGIEDPHPARDDLVEVLGAAHRGTELIRRLLAFSRLRVSTSRSADVNELVRGLAPMIRTLVGEDVEVVTELAEDPTCALVEATGVEQIIVNLAVNARDAMPRGGRLRISTRAVHFGEHLVLAGQASLAPGHYVELTVSDEGMGIPEAMHARIFEPFFSTKDPGHGTGLGLWTCYGIVRNAGGGIAVHSEVGRGTTFAVYFPCAPADHAPVIDDDEIPHERPGAGELVLIIEDDVQVLRAALRVLSRAGYRTLAAASAEQARRLVREQGPAIRLILSDAVLPDARGPELVDELLSSAPRARALFMSGYADASLRRRDLSQLGASALQKPFTSRRLIEAVRRVLADDPSSPTPSF